MSEDTLCDKIRNIMCASKEKRILKLFACTIFCVLFSTCSSSLGWGVLLWSIEDPPIPSGTVLQVFLKSNINKVWIVGIPQHLIDEKSENDKIEIPLDHLDFFSRKSNAEKRAKEFSEFATIYAENLQDGLPVRNNPDNNARRVYRLRLGEIVKILKRVEGTPAISSSGTPLPGEWYKVLTEDGNTGYCFSYRLKLFSHTEGQLAPIESITGENVLDGELEAILEKTWSSESYYNMLNENKINLEELRNNWRFDPGQETGIARIFMPEINRTFNHTAIVPDGTRAWRFEGADLFMEMRSETTIAVKYLDSGQTKTLLFVSLPTSVDDLIVQESARRSRQIGIIYNNGPDFTSSNYGTINFRSNGSFSWRGFDKLIPQYIPESIEGEGTILMNLFLSENLATQYDGAFTMRFSNSEGRPHLLQCMYVIDNQGFRLEIVPDYCIDEITVMRRASLPMVLYFYRD